MDDQSIVVRGEEDMDYIKEKLYQQLVIDYFWQIGINVNKNFEGRHIAAGLVSVLKADILKKGIVPYYGTSFSNLASQHVAAKAGFEVAWVELITERMEC